MTGNGVTEAEQDIDPETLPTGRAAPRREAVLRRLARRIAIFVLIPWGLALIGLSLLESQPVPLPGAAITQIENALGRGLGQGSVTVGDGVIGLSEDWLPEVRLSNIAILDNRGAALGQVNEVRALLSASSVLGGGVLPRSMTVRGAQIIIRRDADGAFALNFGGADRAASLDLAGVIDAIDRAFSTAPLVDVREMSALDLTVTLEDARSGRVWQVTDGFANFTNLPQTLELYLYSEIFNGTEDLAEAEFYFVSDKQSSAAEFGAEIGRAAARDIALQAPALSLLSVLDAPVSGAIEAQIDGGGALSNLAAALSIGPGQLNPEGTAEAVAFRSASVEAVYEPDRQLLSVESLDVQGQWLTLNGSAKVYLTDFSGPWPGGAAGQVRITDIASDTDGVFEGALGLDSVIADLRLDLDPFVVDLGQAVASRGDLRLDASGRFAAGADGWDIALDARSGRVTPAELLRFWPLQAADGARKWIDANVGAGLFRDVTAALRLAPGGAPQFGLTFAFDEAEARFLPDMPPITSARGQGAILGERFTLRLDSGEVSGGAEGALSLAGSQLAVGPLAQRWPDARISVAAVGELGAALTVLDGNPVRVLERIGRDAGLAEARTSATATLTFPLKKDLKAEEVVFAAAGDLTGLRSDVLVPGRRIASDKVSIAVDGDGFGLTGPLRVDDVPMTIAFRQPFAGGAGSGGLPPSVLNATAPLGRAFLDRFGITLPRGMIEGVSEADIRLDIAEGVPPALALSSTLEGAALSIPALGWAKPASAAGTLLVDATLGDAPRIDSLRLEAGGLLAEGAVSTDPGSGFKAVFTQVRSGDWFDAPLSIRPAGQGIEVEITGGTIDLRGVRRDGGPGTGGTGGAAIPVRAALDRLILTDTTAIAPLQADLVSDGGLSGRFQGRVNGRTPVSGELLPTGGRTGLRLTTQDAGGALSDSGIFRSLEGGAMSVTLTPRAEDAGYDGQLRITEARLGDQPAVIDFLDAVSIVGLLDQLRGPGIFFDLVESRFRLYPNGVIIDEGAAIGASIGISLDGVHRFDTKQIDMAGVISPIYLINSIGSALTRRGEGLFGFTFRMTGTSDAPQTRVNPLSILAPGGLREMFRRRPAEGQ